MFLDSSMWITVLVPIFWQDLLVLSNRFTSSLFNLLELCEKIWSKVEKHVNNEVELAKVRRRKNFKAISLFLYSGLIDISTATTYEWSTESLLFVVFFGGTTFSSDSIVGGIQYIILKFYALILSMGWAILLIFPGILTYHLEGIVRGMEKAVKTTPTSLKYTNWQHSRYTLNEIMKDYKALGYAVNHLTSCRLADVLLLFYLTSGIEQTFQAFVAFQSIKEGCSFSDIYYLFQDLALTSTRVFGGFAGLAKLDLASSAFILSVKRAVARECILLARTSARAPNLARRMRYVKQLRPIKMKIGPVACNSNLPLAGMQAYLNYIVCASLWP
ncbi:unnamed protein product [Orchesella dallaii]|uniref:Potassium channel domain-containing protein n=1 Tax=Orchesella dallaii TaxID=48710 RepID=A0ABP1QCM2_9HEXA